MNRNTKRALFGFGGLAAVVAASTFLLRDSTRNEPPLRQDTQSKQVQEDLIRQNQHDFSVRRELVKDVAGLPVNNNYGPFTKLPDGNSSLIMEIPGLHEISVTEILLNEDGTKTYVHSNAPLYDQR